jgi:hypothetical protein
MTDLGELAGAYYAAINEAVAADSHGDMDAADSACERSDGFKLALIRAIGDERKARAAWIGDRLYVVTFNEHAPTGQFRNLMILAPEEIIGEIPFSFRLKPPEPT